MKRILRTLQVAGLLVLGISANVSAEVVVGPPVINRINDGDHFSGTAVATVRIDYKTDASRLLPSSLGDDDLTVSVSDTEWDLILLRYSIYGDTIVATYGIPPHDAWPDIGRVSLQLRNREGSVRDSEGATLAAQDLGPHTLERPEIAIEYVGERVIPKDAENFRFQIRYRSLSPLLADDLPNILVATEDRPTAFLRYGEGYPVTSVPVTIASDIEVTVERDTLGNFTFVIDDISGYDCLGNPLPKPPGAELAAEVLAVQATAADNTEILVDYVLDRPGNFWPVNGEGNLDWQIRGSTSSWVEARLPQVQPLDRVRARLEQETNLIDPTAAWTDLVVTFESDVVPIDPASFGDDDIFYADFSQDPLDPGAIDYHLEKQAEESAKNGHEWSVTYRLHRPEGGWTVDPGTLYVEPGSIRDTFGVGIGPDKLGTSVLGDSPIVTRLAGLQTAGEDSPSIRLRIDYQSDDRVAIAEKVTGDYLVLVPASPTSYLDVPPRVVPVFRGREISYPFGWEVSNETSHEMSLIVDAWGEPIMAPHVVCSGLGNPVPVWLDSLHGHDDIPPGLDFSIPSPIVTLERRGDAYYGPRYYSLLTESPVVTARTLSEETSDGGRHRSVSYEFDRPAGGWPAAFEIRTKAGAVIYRSFQGTPAITGTLTSGLVISDPLAMSHQFAVRFESSEGAIAMESPNGSQLWGLSVGSVRFRKGPWAEFTDRGDLENGEVHPGQIFPSVLNVKEENGGQTVVVTYEMDQPASGWDAWGERALPVSVWQGAVRTNRGESILFGNLDPIQLGFDFEEKPYLVAFEDWLDEFEKQLELPVPSAPEEDTDGDGASNAEEFIMGTDPLDAQDSASLNVETTRVDDAVHLEVAFPMRRDFFGVTPELEGSYDGVDWFNVDADFKLIETEFLRDTVHLLTLQTRQPVSRAKALFVRLTISPLD